MISVISVASTTSAMVQAVLPQVPDLLPSLLLDAVDRFLLRHWFLPKGVSPAQMRGTARRCLTGSPGPRAAITADLRALRPWF
jgi:hypothetical protein